MLRTLLFVFFSVFFLCSCDNFITKSPNFGDIPAGSVAYLVFSTLPSGASTGGFLFPPPSVQVGSSGSSLANENDMLLSVFPQFFEGKNRKNSDALNAPVTLSLYSDAECTTPVLTAPDGITNSLLGTLVQQSSNGGAAIFPDIIITKASSLYLKAEASGFNSICSPAISVSAGTVSSAASTLTYSGFPAIGIPLDVTYTALDEYGNSSPSGYLPAELTFGFSGTSNGVFGSVTNLGNGVFTTVFTPSVAGVESLTLALTSTGGTFNQISGINIITPVDALIFSSFPTTLTAGGTISVTVTVYTSLGGINTGYAQPISLLSSDPLATISPSSSLVPTSGIANFSVTLKTATTGGLLQATGSGEASASQGGITVNAGSASSLSFVNFPASILSGGGFSFFVEAVDSYNNLVSSYTNTLTLLSSDPTATYIPANPTAITSGGLTSVTMTLATVTTGGTLKATSGSLSGQESGIIVVVPNSLVFSSVSATTVTAGETINVTVTAYSSTGGIDTSYTQPISLTSSDLYPATITLLSTSGGVANFSVTLYTATTGGILQATASGKTSATQGVIVNAGPASTLNFANFPSTVWGGNSFSFSIKATDLYGNLISGYTSGNSITLASSDPSAVYLSANPTTITSGGMTSVTMTLYTMTTGGILTATIAGGSLSSAVETGIFVAYLTSHSDLNPIHKVFYATPVQLGEFSVDKTTGLISNGGFGNYTPVTGGDSITALSFALTPDSQFLYLLMQNEQQVYIFDTNQATTGIPTSVGGVAISAAPTVTTYHSPFWDGSSNTYINPALLAVSSDGKYLYVLNQSIAAGGSWIDGFSIAAGSGLLTSLGGIAVVSPLGGTVDGTTIATSSPGHLYVGAFDSSHSDNFVSSFSINSGTGALSQVGTGVSIDGYGLPSVNGLSSVLTPTGNTFLYVAERDPFQISSFSVSPGGQLNLLQQLSVASWATSAPIAIAVSPAGNFLYAADNLGSIYSYPMNSNTGVLSTSYTQVVAGSAYRPSVFMSVTADAKYLNVQSSEIDIASALAYAISPVDGSLTQVSSQALPFGIYSQLLNNNALSYAYIMSYGPNTIQPLQRNLVNGSLNAYPYYQPSSNFNTGMVSTIAQSLAVTNDNKYLYYMILQNSSALGPQYLIYQYAIDPNTGELTPLTTASVSCNGIAVSLATYNNQYFYVPYYAPFAPGTNMIDQYSIGTGGGLIFTTTYSGLATAEISSVDTVMTQTGNSFLYAVDYELSAVYQYQINPATGNLTQLTPSVGGFSTNAPLQILIMQDGQHAYLADSGNERILLLSINQASGQLTSIGGVNVGASLAGIVVTPNMEYLYAIGVDGSNNGVIYSYSIGANMALSSIGTPVSTGEPLFSSAFSFFDGAAATISADSAYLYVGFFNGMIFQYAIAANGILTPLSPSSSLAETSITALAWR